MAKHPSNHCRNWTAEQVKQLRSLVRARTPVT
jgi:hypothetical protein